MPPLNLMRGFIALWLVTGVVLLLGSVLTVWAAFSTPTHHNPHIALLGALEAVSAALFLAPRSMRVGGMGLIGALTIGFALHVAYGQFRTDLLLSGVAVLFVVIHGPLTRQQWQATLSRSAV